MAPTHRNFDNIGLEDLVGENSLLLMTDFTNKCASTPPVSDHTKRPFGTDTLVQCLTCCIKFLKQKFAAHLQNMDVFPEDEVNKWKRKLRNNHNRIMMQGEDETDILKHTFPIPSKHTNRTNLHPKHDFRQPEQHKDYRATDMLSIAHMLFRASRFTDLLKILLTFNGIGRGGEVKFLSYASMFFCCTFNLLFLQWFQRKNLKTNPSGFVPDFEHPELYVFLLFGCFWAVEDGLVRVHGAGQPNTPQS